MEELEYLLDVLGSDVVRVDLGVEADFPQEVAEWTDRYMRMRQFSLDEM